MATKNKAGQEVLEGDGSYAGIFVVTVEGHDLVVKGKSVNSINGVRATCFGGDHDSEDSGDTASGLLTKGHPNLMGCSLPMSGKHEAATEGSPIPALPYLKTMVQIYSRKTNKTIIVPLIDIGPAKPPNASAAIDLTGAAMRALGGNPGSDMSGDLQNVSFRIIGGAQYLKEIRS